MWYVKIGDFIENTLRKIVETIEVLSDLFFGIVERLIVLAAIIAAFAWVFGDARWYIAAPNWQDYDPHGRHLEYATGHNFEASEVACNNRVEDMRKLSSSGGPIYCMQVSLPRHWFNRINYYMNHTNQQAKN